MQSAFYHPDSLIYSANVITTFSSLRLTDPTFCFGWMINPEEDATVLSVLAYTRSRSGTPGILRIGFQGCDPTTGLNDGIWQSYVDVNPMSVTGIPGFLTYTLNFPQYVYRGKTICIFVQPMSGSWTGANQMEFVYGLTNAYPGTHLPYLIGRNGTTGGQIVRLTTGFPALLYGYRSATKTYGYPFYPTQSSAFNMNTTPDEIGMRFTLPSAWGRTFTLLGITANHRFPTGGSATWNLNLYDSDSNLLAQNSFDADRVYVPVPGTNAEGTYQMMFDARTLPDLTYGQTYTVAIQSTNTVNQNALYLLAAQANDYTALTDATLEYVQRSDLGAWTKPSSLFMPNWQLNIYDTDGGRIRYSGMTGGMRG